MKRTMVVMCVLFVLAWVTADALGQGKGKDRPGRPTDRVANPNKAAETAKPDADAPAADTKGTPNVNKGGKGKTKDALDEVKGKGKAAKDAVSGTKGPADKGQGGKGQQHQQQMLALQKQQQHEAAKHLERQARLNRLHELAVQKGDKEMLDRVNKLIAKENEVNTRKLEQLQQQHRALMGGTAMPGTDMAMPPVGKKGKEKVDVNKPAEKPAETKPPENKPQEQAPANAPPSNTAAPTSNTAPQNAPPQEKPAEQPKPQ